MYALFDLMGNAQVRLNSWVLDVGIFAFGTSRRISPDHLLVRLDLIGFALSALQCSPSSAFPSFASFSIFEHGDSLHGNKMIGFTFWRCIKRHALILTSLVSTWINMMSDHEVCRNSKNESKAPLMTLRGAHIIFSCRELR
jgi:hypothetical protein